MVLPIQVTVIAINICESSRNYNKKYLSFIENMPNYTFTLYPPAPNGVTIEGTISTTGNAATSVKINKFTNGYFFDRNAFLSISNFVDYAITNIFNETNPGSFQFYAQIGSNLLRFNTDGVNYQLYDSNYQNIGTTGSPSSLSIVLVPPIIPPAVACFAQGTRLLTENGYKAVETLTSEDRLVTTEGRSTSLTLMTTHVPYINKHSAPYVVAAGALGENKPISPLYISPGHKFLLRDNVWIIPAKGAKMGLDIKQYSIGKEVTYYHVRCENYSRDVIIAEGVATESFATTQEYNNTFTFSKKTGLFLRKEYKEPSKSLKA